MPLTVFYAWQSDTPSRVSRNFIEDALNKALRKVNADAEVVNAARGEEVILEKDTKGLPGTPPIMATISPSQARVLAIEGDLKPFALRNVIGGQFCDRNRYGSVSYRSDRDTPFIEELTQLFKNRELWGITCELQRSGDPRLGILPNTHEAAFTRALENYLRFAREKLQLKLPLRLVAGLTGIEGFKFAAPYGYQFGAGERLGGRAVEPDIVRDAVVDDWDMPADQILVPFFKGIWDAFGVGARPNLPI